MAVFVSPLTVFLGAYTGASFAYDKKYDIPISAGLGAVTAVTLPPTLSQVALLKGRVGAVALGAVALGTSVFYLTGVYYGVKSTTTVALKSKEQLCSLLKL